MLGEETFGKCLSHEIRVLATEINGLIKGPGSCLASSIMYRTARRQRLWKEGSLPDTHSHAALTLNALVSGAVRNKFLHFIRHAL